MDITGSWLSPVRALACHARGRGFESHWPRHKFWCILRTLGGEMKTFTMTIEETGDLTFLDTDSAEAFLDIGETTKRRASHVEPAVWGYRVVFHVLRFFGDKNRLAEWTRHWPVLWRVNTKPVGGPIMKLKHAYPQAPWVFPAGEGIAVWGNRQDAIEAEIKFLNEWFANR